MRFTAIEADVRAMVTDPRWTALPSSRAPTRSRPGRWPRLTAAGGSSARTPAGTSRIPVTAAGT
ncbi:hypothetical protein [Nonomuraea recticatena]|uniref:hypothetical protein n=1 Tax=Nonomuraea recticatena TaxID=46178 RepID=UPI0036148AB7